MIRFLIRVAIYLATAALGLLAAAWILDDFNLSTSGFILAVVVFALAQSILTPFIFNLARKHAPRVMGGIGLVSTFVALLVASLAPGGLSITGIATWILASLIVWVTTTFGGWLLPLIFLKEKAENRNGKNAK